MSAFPNTTNTHTWTLALTAAALLLAFAPQVASPGRADNGAACRPEASAALDALRLEVDPTRRVLVDYLARRFSIAAAPTSMVVEAAYRAAEESGLDPLLVLAVISVESRFNPIAESVMGAKGLMQIIPKYHRARLLEHGGEEALFDPESNILVGTKILQEYVYRTGTLEAGLQTYNGASRDATAQYAQRVLAERGRFEQALRVGLATRAALDAKGEL